MTRYPLAWPAGWKRTHPHFRVHAKFNKKAPVYHDGKLAYYRAGDLTIAEGTKRVLEQLRAFGVPDGDAIISTNLKVRLDGLPRSDQKEPDDPGVAVYWQRASDHQHKVMAIDQYKRIADNLAAIAATLEAMRAIERHGGAVILERAFTGFDALPSPNDWRHVLGFEQTPTFADAKAKFLELSKSRHPDKGGSDAAMSELNWAIEQAERELC